MLKKLMQNFGAVCTCLYDPETISLMCDAWTMR